MSQQFTTKEVAEHKDESAGLYIIIDNGVYSMSGMSNTILVEPTKHTNK